MKTAIITGISGQDGAYLADFLLNESYKVYGTYRRTSDEVTGKTVLSINPKFYRSAEAGLLKGDYTKAKTVLVWGATTTPEELCKMRVEADLKRNKLGFTYSC